MRSETRLPQAGGDGPTRGPRCWKDEIGGSTRQSLGARGGGPSTGHGPQGAALANRVNHRGPRGAGCVVSWGQGVTRSHGGMWLAHFNKSVVLRELKPTTPGKAEAVSGSIRRWCV